MSNLSFLNPARIYAKFLIINGLHGTYEVCRVYDSVGDMKGMKDDVYMFFIPSLFKKTITYTAR